jgi:hypothetical protein
MAASTVPRPPGVMGMAEATRANENAASVSTQVTVTSPTLQAAQGQDQDRPGGELQHQGRQGHLDPPCLHDVDDAGPEVQQLPGEVDRPAARQASRERVDEPVRPAPDGAGAVLAAQHHREGDHRNPDGQHPDGRDQHVGPRHLWPTTKPGP